MEPTSVLTGINSVLKAAEGISKLKTDADKLAPEDARYYAAYLDIASQAIKGLEQEYIEILVEAAHCNIDDLEQKRHLLMRIDTYTTREILRPELRAAIEHLRTGREALSQNAERLLIWPKVKKIAVRPSTNLIVLSTNSRAISARWVIMIGPVL